MAGAVFDALGDPVRRRILELLGDGERPVGAIAHALHGQFGISQPATSQQLRVLRRSGLVTVRAEGTRRIYGVDTAGLAVVQDWLARFADAFAQPLDALKTELARGRRERRRAGSPDPARQMRRVVQRRCDGAGPSSTVRAAHRAHVSGMLGSVHALHEHRSRATRGARGCAHH